MSDPIPAISDTTSVTGFEPLLTARFGSLQGTTRPTAAQLKKVAQDFEGVLLEKLMQEMQNTVPDAGMFNSAGRKQIQGMFWSFLSQKVAEGGGIGLARSLYRDLCLSAGVDPAGTTDATPPSRKHAAKFMDTATEPVPRMELER